MPEILSETLALLKNRPRYLTYEIIELDTKISIRWLTYLAANKVKDPGIKRLEKLRAYLLDKKLQSN